MNPELILTLGGPGSALVVLMLWIRSITKDRDFYRDRYEENNKALKIAVEELENPSKSNNPSRLKIVRNGE